MHFLTKILTVLLVFSQPYVAFCDTELLILHSNDARARFDEVSRRTGGYCSETLKNEFQCMGGLSRAFKIVNDNREKYNQTKGPKTLYFYAGSIFTGSIWFRLFKAKIATAFMNLLRPDGINLGKSEFHYDLQTLGDYVSGLQVPVVSTNYNTTGLPLLRNIKRYVKIVVGPLTIGVMGYIKQGVRDWVHFEVDLAGKEAIVEAAKELHSQGANFIILMSSDGYKRDLEFARTIPYLDLIIGAGGQTLLWNREAEPPPEPINVDGPYPMVVASKAAGHKERYVVRTPPLSKYLGFLRLTVNSQGAVTKFSGQPVFLSQELPGHKEAHDLLEVYRSHVIKEERTVIATSKVFLEGDPRECTQRECNMGSLICDAYVDYMVEKWPAYPRWTYVAVALINADSLQSSVDIEPPDYTVTRMDLMEVRPIDDTVCIFRMRGDHLLEMLQRMADNAFAAGRTRQSFIQVSGIRMEINTRKTRGSKVTSVHVRCADCQVPRLEPLDPNRSYNVVTSRVVGDGYWGGGIVPRLSDTRTYEHDADITIIERYMSRKGIIHPENDGRIRILQGLEEGNTSARGVECGSVAVVVALVCTFALK